MPRVRLTVIARSNYDAVKENGIILTSENHGKHTVRPYKGALLLFSNIDHVDDMTGSDMTCKSGKECCRDRDNV